MQLFHRLGEILQIIRTELLRGGQIIIRGLKLLIDVADIAVVRRDKFNALTQFSLQVVVRCFKFLIFVLKGGSLRLESRDHVDVRSFFLFNLLSQFSLLSVQILLFFFGVVKLLGKSGVLFLPVVVRRIGNDADCEANDAHQRDNTYKNFSYQVHEVTSPLIERTHRWTIAAGSNAFTYFDAKICKFYSVGAHARLHPP